MKTIHVLYSFPTRLGVPGIGTTAWHQVQGLADLGVRVTLYCGSLERPLSGVERVVETMKLGPVPLSYRVMGLDRAMGWHDWRVAAALMKAGGDVDVVHCWPSGALRTLTVARALGVASVLERPSSHTLDVYEVAQSESRRLGVSLDGHQYARFNEKRLAKEELEFRLPRFLLCPSEAAAKTFRHRGFAEDVIRLHQYGFDPRVFSPPGETTAPAPLRAVFVGLGFPLKGLHVALEAWCTSTAASTGGTFSICGEIQAGYRKVLARQLAHPSVKVLGYRRDVANVMRGHDVLIHPSLSEGSALVTYEAQACGLVPVVSDAAGARSTHMRTGLIHTAGDVQTLRSHVNLLAERPDVLAQLRAGVLAALPDLTWSAAASRLLAIYDEARACGGRVESPETLGGAGRSRKSPLVASSCE